MPILRIFALLICFNLSKCFAASPVKLQTLTDTPKEADHDCTVFINDDPKFKSSPNSFIESIRTSLEPIANNINFLGWKPSVHYVPALPGKRIIFSSTRKLNTDISDSRNIYRASLEALEFAVKLGAKKPLLVLGPMESIPSSPTSWQTEQYRFLNAVLGALQGLYVQYDLVVANRILSKYEILSVYIPTGTFATWVKKYATAIEEGRWVARDLCGADPEVMNPENFVKYVKTLPFTSEIIEITNQTYPMAAALERVNRDIPRFKGKIISVKYGIPNPQKALFMAGEALTFDTGGLDIRKSEKMVGASRKKCGGAGILGFIRTVHELIQLQTTNKIYINARISLARNNIGSGSLSLDDIILSKLGKLTRVGFTQAASRLIVAEQLDELVDEIISSTAEMKEIYTVTTMSEHVTRVWKEFTGIMGNGVAVVKSMREELQNAGNHVSDMGEISDLIKEDYDSASGPLETEDLRASAPSVSEGMSRGHMKPPAYMIRASKLNELGLGKSSPIKYIHLDVSGSSGMFPARPTGAPISMLTQHYFMRGDQP